MDDVKAYIIIGNLLIYIKSFGHTVIISLGEHFRYLSKGVETVGPRHCHIVLKRQNKWAV